jgi:acetyltransferase-like isoleucine patch superfamily enzyme
MTGIISRFLSRISASRRHQARLAELRAENPSCIILSIPSCNVRMGENVAILTGVHLDQVSLGNFSYVSSNSRLINVTIGNFCSIGPDVQVGLPPHPSRIFVSSYPAFYSNCNEGCPLSFVEDKTFDDSVPKTCIGNDVWIGSNVIIIGGIQIATGAIVGAGSVVVKDVPPYAVVGGNPAKVIRYRFSEEQIEILMASEWWNWPIERILQNVDKFSDMEKFKAIIN